MVGFYISFGISLYCEVRDLILVGFILFFAPFALFVGYSWVSNSFTPPFKTLLNALSALANYFWVSWEFLCCD